MCLLESLLFLFQDEIKKEIEKYKSLGKLNSEEIFRWVKIHDML